ncbi:hypothetical protein MJO29_014257 [Puccinia striiformis f. sp. tritici]|nr:hypothetical protein MJO29_014257 [Puccinia striiformis f. sp. tritici]
MIENLIKASKRSSHADQLWELIKDEMYCLELVPILDIGKPSASHLSNDYPNSPDITDLEIKLVQSICDQNHISTLNTSMQWDTKVFDLQVANHKLLGHGSVLFPKRLLISCELHALKLILKARE